MRAVLRWVAWWAALAAFWLLLVDNTKLPELITGGAAAALAATAAVVVLEQGLVRLSIRAGWLRRAGILAAALWRRLVLRRRVEGELRAVRFRGGDDPASTARRALAKGFDSIGPNSYVIGIDSEEDVMIVHQLVPPGDPASADPMELR